MKLMYFDVFSFVSYSEGSESGYSGAYERGSEFSEIDEPGKFI